MSIRKSPGHTINEYGLLFALLLVLSIGGVTLLGGSIQNLLAGAAQSAGNSGNYLGGTAATANAAVLPTAGIQLTGTSTAPLTPLSVKSADAAADSLRDASPVAVNVSSVDGNDRTVLGNLRLAQKLDQLAEASKNPDDQGYYYQLARLAYFMGANEGQLDNFDTYAFGSTKYTKGDALNDLVSQSTRLKELLANPPATLSQQELAEVMPLARQVESISDSYLNNLKPLLNSSTGKVTFDFGLDTAKGSAAVAAGEPTPIFTDSLKYTTYDTLVTYEQLKTQVDETLSTHPLSSNPPVVTTFHDARETDRKGRRD